MVPPHPRRHLQPHPHLDQPHTLATPSPHTPQLPHRHKTLHNPHHQHRSRLRRRCHPCLPRRKRNRTISDRLTRDHRPPCRSERLHRQTRPTSPHSPRSRSGTRSRSLPQSPGSDGCRIAPRAPPIPRSIDMGAHHTSLRSHDRHPSLHEAPDSLARHTAHRRIQIQNHQPEPSTIRHP